MALANGVFLPAAGHRRLTWPERQIRTDELPWVSLLRLVPAIATVLYCHGFSKIPYGTQHLTSIPRGSLQPIACHHPGRTRAGCFRQCPVLGP